MQIKTLVVGPVETNCYIVINEQEHACVLVDPGDESNAILDYVESQSLKVSAILLTHGHFDHVNGVPAIVEETNAVVYMHRLDDASERHSPYFPLALPANGRYYSEGDIINEAGLSFSVLETPGHTPGSVSLICEDALFTGDTLFCGSCGRTDLEGGDSDTELKSLKKLCAIEGEYDVFPGHMDQTTLFREKNFNPYCRMAQNS